MAWGLSTSPVTLKQTPSVFFLHIADLWSNGLCYSRQDRLQCGITEKTLIHLSHSIKDQCIANHTVFPPTQQIYVEYTPLQTDEFPAKLRMSVPPLGPCFIRLTLIKWQAQVN